MLGMIVLSLPVLLGCEMAENYTKADRSGDLTTQDYRDALAPREVKPEALAPAAGNVPAMQPYMASPGKTGKPMPLVSVSVNQDVPVRDVLYELADQAHYDIELDPRIRGSIIFTARNRPLDDVIERIAEIAGLRYQLKNDMIRVELDTAYNKIYKIDYLNYVRESNSKITNDVSVVSGEGADAGSSFDAASKSEANFWAELETNITQILSNDTSNSALKTASDPAPIPPLQPVGGDVATLAAAGASASSAAVNTAAAESTTSFSINKQGGLVSVHAPERLHKKIAAYLDILKKSVTSQVLIEAKVLEVALNDEFSAGIDWTTVGLAGGEGLIEFDSVGGGLTRAALNPATSPTSNFVMSMLGNDFGATMNAISRFGTVKALASPRLTVLNNQSAILNVAQNQVYFEIDISTNTNDGVTQTDVSSEIHNVPEGVLINVQPAIDLANETISMAVRPTITRVTSFVNDPAVAFASAGLATPIVSQVPVVNVQEFDSVVQMHSAQAIVMGGLIQDRTTSEQNGVPVLSELPLIGGAFRNHTDKIEKTELVILLKATIVENGKNIHQTDRDLYKTFSQDRRPFKL